MCIIYIIIYVYTYTYIHTYIYIYIYIELLAFLQSTKVPYLFLEQFACEVDCSTERVVLLLVDGDTCVKYLKVSLRTSAFMTANTTGITQGSNSKRINPTVTVDSRSC